MKNLYSILEIFGQYFLCIQYTQESAECNKTALYLKYVQSNDFGFFLVDIFHFVIYVGLKKKSTKDVLKWLFQ
ncbi:hypothetical protein GDO78_011051 [Eleutherodactylus coqui]|uniref:Uncharacterized protein n=1 Tax=Eleutherodactylus coqui TaxID=57060 RepID=A0A8J6F534_ELECQ|nr:hypothetical protein GDO78_011051 [Eleutherodactylus coqui]